MLEGKINTSIVDKKNYSGYYIFIHNKLWICQILTLSMIKMTYFIFTHFEKKKKTNLNFMLEFWSFSVLDWASWTGK